MDLDALAGVDRDGRLLAGLERFKDVRINFGSEKQKVPEQLEVVERHRSCVRRLNVEYDRERKGLGGRGLLNEYSILVPDLPTANDDADLELHACQDATLVHKSLSASFHNLITLDWDGPPILSANLLHSIKDHSTLRNLHLKGMVLDPEFALSLPCDLSLKLETIALDVHFPLSLREDVAQGKQVMFFDNVFRIAARSVQRVNWKGHFTEEIAIYVDPSIVFAELRHLTLDMVSFADSEVLNLFMGDATTPSTSKLRSLAIDVSTPSAREYLRTRGNIPTLKHFTWINYNTTDASYEDVHTFLEDNARHLESVHFPHAIPQDIIDEQLLPLLSSAATSLTSLHLVSDASSFPEGTLRLLGSISTLKRLWISAGTQGFRGNWEVDHALICDTLAPLRDLRTLAFSHEAYVTEPAPHPLASRFCDYYTAKVFPDKLDLRAYLTPEEKIVYDQCMCGKWNLLVSQQLWHLRNNAWERWHAERMGRVGKAYKQVFPQLEWCFVGQIPVDTVDGVVVPGEREQCLFSLRRKMDMGLWRPL